MNLFQEIATRSYGFGEILDKAVREVFSRRFLDYFLPVLILALILGAVYLPMRGDMRAMMRASVEMEEGYGDSEHPFADTEFWRLWRKTMLTGLLCMLICIPAVLYLLLKMKANIMGETITTAELLKRAADPLRGLGLIFSSLVAGIAIWIASLLLLIPGLILSAYFALLPACVAFDENRISVPLGRPFRLVSGKFGKTLGVFFVLCAAFFVVGMILILPMVITQMGESGIFGAADPDAAALEYYDSLFSAPFLALQGFYFFVQAIFYLLLGCATVIMVLNYTFVPGKGTAGPEPNAEALSQG